MITKDMAFVNESAALAGQVRDMQVEQSTLQQQTYHARLKTEWPQNWMAHNAKENE